MPIRVGQGFQLVFDCSITPFLPTLQFFGYSPPRTRGTIKITRGASCLFTPGGRACEQTDLCETRQQLHTPAVCGHYFTAERTQGTLTPVIIQCKTLCL